ncbi:hypothetical protein LPB137_03090 [Poseidonibacter parvus]|uniref:Response regulatory domain-containing protein n=1 Tax=Poseidonibacter parvus TaxID=1850254 RepID=A0A1P8KK19_9BACT|nr:hypothetical protein [Poseidonibacter parvus]APW64899.1 hypothetical protein LPB137_03090 [Poseidonibacter parvus]
MMKILVFDLEINENDIYDIVEKYIRNTVIHKTNRTDIFLEKIKQINYDLLVIDVTTSLGDNIFKEATKLNKNYNFLVISTTLTYNSELSCKECSFEYKRKLLLKPLSANDLVNYIENYHTLPCKYSVASTNIIEILEDVMKQFTYYAYIKDLSKITLIQEKSNIKELISIIELLNIHKINYIVDNDDIKLIY